jgi:hypothetical protein
MSRDNDRRRNHWDDEYETEDQETFHDPYPPKSRSSYNTQDRPGTDGRTGSRGKSASKPGGGRIYEEGREQPPTRPRPTRQSQAEAYARLRQRPHQPIYSREQEEHRARSASQAKKRPERADPRREEFDEPAYQPPPRRRSSDEHISRRPEPPETTQTSRRTAPINPRYVTSQRTDERYEEHDEYREYARATPRRQGTGYASQRRPDKRRRGRGLFSTILIGCLGGLITLLVLAGVIFFVLAQKTPILQNIGKSPATQSSTQSISLGKATQLIIKNQIGNISINVDPTASGATLTSTRNVLASSQSDASNQFKQIQLTTQQIGQATDSTCIVSSCLLISATVPTVSSNESTSSIDLTLTLPSSVNSLNPDTLNANTASGNITVSKFNGILNLSNTSGSISITQALVFAGSCVQTMHGNITIDQGSIFNLNQASNRVPCSNTISSGQHPWFNITSGIGNIDITLNAPSSDVLLDANTNSGQITDDFGITIPNNSDGSASYHGPLISHTNPAASLYVASSTGYIKLHKQ